MKWRVIPNWENYEVSSDGRVRNRTTGRILSPGINNAGYHLVVLCKDKDTHKSSQIHQLVASAFCSKPPGKVEVNHRDGFKLNNYWRNLEWVTRSENMIHATLNNLRPNGKASHLWKKLRPEDVLKIRRLARTGLSQQTIGDQFGVSQTYVGKIMRKKKWRHL